MLWYRTDNLPKNLGAFGGGGMHVIYVLADSAIVDNKQLDLS